MVQPSKPLVSVVSPTFNRERYLVEERYDRETLADRFEAMRKEITPHVIG